MLHISVAFVCRTAVVLYLFVLPSSSFLLFSRIPRELNVHCKFIINLSMKRVKCAYYGVRKASLITSHREIHPILDCDHVCCCSNLLMAMFLAWRFDGREDYIFV